MHTLTDGQILGFTWLLFMSLFAIADLTLAAWKGKRARRRGR